jgi:hypothetical protein
MNLAFFCLSTFWILSTGSIVRQAERVAIRKNYDMTSRNDLISALSNMILALNNDFSYREKKTFFDNQTKRFQNPEIEFNLEKSVEFKT